jgi:predicted ArsR family transcriptional regulator
MKRQEFLKSACTLGICSCAAIPFLSSADVFAKSGTPIPEDEDWKIGFMQRRFAKLIEAMNSGMDQTQKEKMLEAIGRACAVENKDRYLKFKNDPEGWLAKIEKEWAEKTEYDKEKNTIRIVGRKAESCFCPFVDKTKTPKEFCNCSVGNLKETYETILDKKVDVKIEESILYGGQQCRFLVTVIS